MHATQARLYTKDEELGKRDDDFRPKKAASPAASHLLQPWKWRRRRQVMAVAVLAVIYLFIHNIPTDLGPWNQRNMPVYVPEIQGGAAAPRRGGVAQVDPSTGEPIGAPPRPPMEGEERENNMHYFSGPIKFYRLKDTLRSAMISPSDRMPSRNVLFAVSSLQSAAHLLPLVCEMARADRNFVHMAFLGRNALSLDDVLNINGVDRDACKVTWHDARADYSEYSSDLRAEVSVGGGIRHIHHYVRPQVIITDDSAVEDHFFTRAVRAKGRELDLPVIEVPDGRYEDFFWMARLDSGSLSNWFNPKIDILVLAPQASSGSLIRLLRSLERADFAGLTPPKLTIEMPSKIEPFAKQFIEGFKWPPGDDASPIQQDTLTIRHRIPSARMGVEQASLHFLELFYPRATTHNHVLVLSPQAELSPLFMHYLTYIILEYEYPTYASTDMDNVLGISLDVPVSFLNGSAGFTPPSMSQMNAAKYLEDPNLDKQAAAPFLYQAPSSTASLIYGRNWVTFHDFLTNRLAASRTGVHGKAAKLVSETEPAWLEYMLELMRARGWHMLHPARSFVKLHNELAQIPEEFLKGGKNGKESEKAQDDDNSDGPFLMGPEQPVLAKHAEREPVGIRRTRLTDILPFDGDLPELAHLPYVLHDGTVTNMPTATQLSNDWVPIFRRRIGGCDDEDALIQRGPVESLTDDLFCLPGWKAQLESAKDVSRDDSESIAEAIVQAAAPPMDVATSEAGRLSSESTTATSA